LKYRKTQYVVLEIRRRLYYKCL